MSHSSSTSAFEAGFSTPIAVTGYLPDRPRRPYAGLAHSTIKSPEPTMAQSHTASPQLATPESTPSRDNQPLPVPSPLRSVGDPVADSLKSDATTPLKGEQAYLEKIREQLASNVELGGNVVEALRLIESLQGLGVRSNDDVSPRPASGQACDAPEAVLLDEASTTSSSERGHLDAQKELPVQGEESQERRPSLYPTPSSSPSPPRVSVLQSPQAVRGYSPPWISQWTSGTRAPTSSRRQASPTLNQGTPPATHYPLSPHSCSTSDVAPAPAGYHHSVPQRNETYSSPNSRACSEAHYPQMYQQQHASNASYSGSPHCQTHAGYAPPLSNSHCCSPQAAPLPLARHSEYYPHPHHTASPYASHPPAPAHLPPAPAPFYGLYSPPYATHPLPPPSAPVYAGVASTQYVVVREAQSARDDDQRSYGRSRSRSRSRERSYEWSRRYQSKQRSSRYREKRSSRRGASRRGRYLESESESESKSNDSDREESESVDEYVSTHRKTLGKNGRPSYPTTSPSVTSSGTCPSTRSTQPKAASALGQAAAVPHQVPHGYNSEGGGMILQISFGYKSAGGVSP